MRMRERKSEDRRERGEKERDLGEVPPGADTPNVLFKVQEVGSEGRERIVVQKKMHAGEGKEEEKQSTLKVFVRNVPVHIFRVLDGKWF